jgi:hypothetical protein
MQQLLLAGNVVVKATLLQAYSVGDLLHGRAVEATLAEYVRRGADDILSTNGLIGWFSSHLCLTELRWFAYRMFVLLLYG